MRRAAALLATLLVAGAPLAAQAYVRSRTSKGTPTAWRSSCVLVQPDSAGSPDVDDASLLEALKRSMDVWRSSTTDCSYIDISYVEPASVDAHFDGHNIIKFRTDRWCHPDDDRSSGVCYSSIAAGITTVYYADRPGQPDDGTMLDADVELNNLDFTFDVVEQAAPISKTPRPGTTIADVENTLVHELGHLLGLDHTCADTATPAQEVDQNGNRPPSCGELRNLDQAARLTITEATMFNSAAPAEIKKRTPEADDVAAICAAYPKASDPGECAPQDVSAYMGNSRGCAMSPGADQAPLGWLLVLACLLAARLRRAEPAA